MIGLALALIAAPQEWPVGLEREVDEGVYMQVAAEDHGWRIWRTENRNGVFCTAIKPAIGQQHPVPVGVINLMSRATPFIEVDWNDYLKRFSYSWGAAHYGGVNAKYRVPGERFWEDTRHGPVDLAVVAEKTIEAVVESYEYPALDLGRAEETATFDLTGLGWAQEEARRCEDAGR